MKKINLDDINILDIGKTIQISGAIWSGKGKHYICFLPEENDSDLNNKFEFIDMSVEDWEKFIRQTDLLETEILNQAKNGKLIKVIIRKTARMIDTRIQWRVFKRDKYTCRYCGNDNVPLTVDHIVLWEEGGATIEDNLIASCKKCNKTRGNTQYLDWLQSEYYKKKSANLAYDIIAENEGAWDTAVKVPKMIHKKSR